ncbi:MAG: TatD family hydrolase [Sediminibacterium sp.]
MIIDTHSHVYLDVFKEDLAEVVKRAKSFEVSKVLLPNIDEASIAPMLKLCEKYPSFFYSMIGLHPCDVNEDFEDVLARMKALIPIIKPIGIGETGIDLHWKQDNLEIQKKSFIEQINWAKEFNLPLIIHARESFKEIFACLDEHDSPELRGVFHCFNGNENEIQKISSYCNFYFGIGGTSTYKKNQDGSIQKIPLEKLVVETDAPYLSPVPQRGKRNEPAFIAHTVEFIAKSLELSFAETAALTTENAKQLFHFD